MNFSLTDHTPAFRQAQHTVAPQFGWNSRLVDQVYSTGAPLAAQPTLVQARAQKKECAMCHKTELLYLFGVCSVCGDDQFCLECVNVLNFPTFGGTEVELVCCSRCTAAVQEWRFRATIAAALRAADADPIVRCFRAVYRTAAALTRHAARLSELHQTMTDAMFAGEPADPALAAEAQDTAATVLADVAGIREVMGLLRSKSLPKRGPCEAFVEAQIKRHANAVLAEALLAQLEARLVLGKTGGGAVN